MIYICGLVVILSSLGLYFMGIYEESLIAILQSIYLLIAGIWITEKGG